MMAFNGKRFIRVLANDLQQNWRKLWISTAGMMGLVILSYITNVESGQSSEPEIFLALFPLVLFGGGLVFTSIIFADMHHPLQRFHYLTLPCSNVERFLSRYLLTAPLLYLYVVLIYWITDGISAGLSNALMDVRAAKFTLAHGLIVWLSLGFFFLHAIVFTGAIFFRSYHLIKTVLAVMLFLVGLGIVQVISTKLFFWDFFTSLWSLEGSAVSQPLFLGEDYIQFGFLLLLHLWMLFIAWRCLCEHEVQDEL